MNISQDRKDLLHLVLNFVMQCLGSSYRRYRNKSHFVCSLTTAGDMPSLSSGFPSTHATKQTSCVPVSQVPGNYCTHLHFTHTSPHTFCLFPTVPTQHAIPSLAAHHALIHAHVAARHWAGAWAALSLMESRYGALHPDTLSPYHGLSYFAVAVSDIEVVQGAFTALEVSLSSRCTLRYLFKKDIGIGDVPTLDEGHCFEVLFSGRKASDFWSL